MFTEDTFLISAQNKKFPLSRNNLPKKPQRQFTIVYTEPYTALFPSSTSPIREEHPPRRPPRYKHKSQQRPPSGVSLITLITSEQRLWREFARNIRSERCKEGVYRVTKGSIQNGAPKFDGGRRSGERGADYVGNGCTRPNSKLPAVVITFSHSVQEPPSLGAISICPPESQTVSQLPTARVRQRHRTRTASRG